MDKPRKAYKTFEDFSKRVELVGLKAAWEQQERGTGRTTQEVARAVHAACKYGHKHIGVIAKDVCVAKDIAIKVRRCLAALEMNDVVVSCPTPGCMQGRHFLDETLCIDHTFRETHPNDLV